MRQGIAATHELLHENHRRLFRAGEHTILCEHYINQRAALLPQLEAALDLPENMIHTLQKRSAQLSLCAADGPPECTVGDVPPAQALAVKAPAAYPTSGMVTALALSACGRLCCAGNGGGGVFVYDTTTAGQVVQLKHGATSLACVAFSRCGKWLASASRDKTVAVFCTATWECTHTLQGHPAEIRAVAWTHTSYLVTASFDQSLRVWGVAQGVCTAERKQAVHGILFSIAVSHTSIFATAPDSWTIYEWDVKTLQHTHSLPGHTDHIPPSHPHHRRDTAGVVLLRHVCEGMVHDHTHLPADDGGVDWVRSLPRGLARTQAGSSECQCRSRATWWRC